MKIVLIGGGEIGRPGFPVETTKIDKEIIALTGKKNPRVLFIPTASSDSEGYTEVFNKHYGKRLGCKTDVLYLLKEKISKKQIEEKVFGADIVYVGGGNTAKLMKAWRKAGLDKILKKAGDRGVILSGVSAGSICWCKYGLSDSRKFNNPDAPLIKVAGLGFIDALHSPHYDFEAHRKDGLIEMMKKTSGVAIAIDNCCALEVIDDKYRVISSKKGANAYKVYWKREEFYEETIKQDKNFNPLTEILEK
ncbi:MAG: peptidase E [Candidatus Omnitrophica bacterium]|nr:peptidase E [Candidatus Omnitrophota bacterium]